MGALYTISLNLSCPCPQQICYTSQQTSVVPIYHEPCPKSITIEHQWQGQGGWSYKLQVITAGERPSTRRWTQVTMVTDGEAGLPGLALSSRNHMKYDPMSPEWGQQCFIIESCCPIHGPEDSPKVGAMWAFEISWKQCTSCIWAILWGPQLDLSGEGWLGNRPGHWFHQVMTYLIHTMPGLISQQL